MLNRIKQFLGLGKKELSDDVANKLASEWYERKSKLMEVILGPEHDMVMHAIIPYAVGGPLDLYYYPHSKMVGTCIATKELSEMPDEGSSNRVFSCYELAMFTRHSLDLDIAHDDSTPFGQAHSNISRILNNIASYSASATLNPDDTCEFPADMEKLAGKCLIFDAYGSVSETKKRGFGILAVIEIHSSEMNFARSNGGRKLIDRLNKVGAYPYSDLDREPVA